MIERTDKPGINVTAALIWKDERLLISKRPKGSHLAGLWEFPGGKQEANESLEECLKREIKEELGIDIRVDEFLFKVQHEYDTRLVNLHIFKCTSFKGLPEGQEGQDIKWVVPADLRKHEFPPPDLEIIEYLIAP